MSRKDDEIIESLIAGGLIGAALATLLSNKKNAGENALLGAIAGAAILASFKANQNAKKTEIPIVVEEDDAIYEITTEGKRKLIKQLPKSRRKVQKKFTLK